MTSPTYAKVVEVDNCQPGWLFGIGGYDPDTTYPQYQVHGWQTFNRMYPLWVEMAVLK